MKSSSTDKSMFFVSEMKRMSWSIVMGSSPNFSMRVLAKYSQSHMRCMADSCTSSSQKLQWGAVVKSILFWKWLRLL